MRVLAVTGFLTALSGAVDHAVGPGTIDAHDANVPLYSSPFYTHTNNRWAVINIANPIHALSTAELAGGWIRAPLIDRDKP
jgi:hypothetical protein